MELTLTLSLIIIICNYSWRTAAQGMPGESLICQVEYTEQPPDQLQCNPYINAELRLECTVTAQPNQNPTLVWYRRQLVRTQQSQEQQQEEEDSSQSRSKRSEQWIVEKLNPSQDVYIFHQARSSTTSTAARSRLMLRNLGGSDSGEYYCVVQIDGAELTVPSDAVFLQEPTFYSSLSACATTGALSKEENKCADGSTVTTASSSVPDISNSQPTVTPTAKGITTSSSSPAKPPTMTVSKPTSPETGGDGGADGGATTDAVPNPVDKETGRTPSSTVDPTQAGNTDDSESVSAEEEVIEESPTMDTDDNPNILLELYIAIAILVIFGVIIMILIPITVWMCLKKRQTQKVEGIRRTRHNLEFGSAHCSELQSPSAVSQVASDYLVPQPSWRSRKQQVQPSDCQKTPSLQRSYEITLSYSHEYEDVRDVIEEGTTQLDTYVNDTMEILEASGSPPAHIGVYVNDRPVRMKRNAAYRMYSTVNSGDSLRRNGYCNEVTVSNPLNCLYTAQHSTNEQQSNLE